MLFVLMLAVPQEAKADNGRVEVLKNELNYSVIPKGNGIYTIKVPVYVGSRLGNYWAEDKCVINVAVGGQKYELLNYKADNFGNDAGTVNDVQIKFDRKGVGLGLCSFTNADKTVKEVSSQCNDWVKIRQKMSKDIKNDYNTTYLEFDWKGNYTLFNDQTIEFYVDAVYTEYTLVGSPDKEHVEMKLATLPYSSTLTPPVIAGAYLNTDVNDGDEGQVRVVGYSTTKPTKLEWFINGKSSDVVEMINETSFEYMLPASDDVRIVKVAATYVEDGLATVLESKPYMVAPYHRIKDMEISEVHANTPEISSGAKKLSWSLDKKSQSDMFENDYFFVERAYTQDMVGAVRVGTVAFCDSVSWGCYEFIDESDGATINPETGGKTYYRVCRSTATGLYFTQDNIFSVAKGIDNMVAYQPKVTELNVREPYPDFLENHKVTVEIKLDIKGTKKTETQNGVSNNDYYEAKWNDDAKLMLYIKRVLGDDECLGTDSLEISSKDVSYNGDGTYVSFLEYTLHEPTVKYVFSAKVVKPSEKSQMQFVSFEGNADRDHDDGKEGGSSYFSEIGYINNVTATQGTEYGFVRVSWDTPTTRLDSLVVLRREKGNERYTLVELATLDPSSTYYEDRKALLGVEYEYGVRCILTTRDGRTSKRDSWTKWDSEPAYGFVSPTGKVAGKVVTLQGSGIGGQEVNITKDGDLVQRVKTNDDGTFEFLDIPLQTDNVFYQVQVPSQQLQYTCNGGTAGAKISLGATNPLYEDVKFICSTVVRFSGRVLFENSTIPVSGAMFRINGEQLHDVNDMPIKTDNNGNFEFYVPKHQVEVQVYKPGHRFVNDGYILDKDKDEKKFTPNSAYDGLTLYDQTKVLLRGRIIGGNTLAAMPLGQGLTKNNLGDSITLQIKLEGNNTANIVFLSDQPDKDSLVVINEQQWEGKTVTRTRGEFFRKQIDIHVDNETGEYAMEMFPTKYKVTQAFAQGYASLFNHGEVAQVIDLTDSVDVQNPANTKIATHSITYHSDVDITYEQLAWGVSPQPFLGVEKLKKKNMFGTDVTTTFAYVNENDSVKYLLDAPVFFSGEHYFLRGTAHEDYYYNNEKKGLHFIEPIRKDTVNVQNGLAGNDPKNEQFVLDENGQFFVKFIANNNNFALTGKDALRQLHSSVVVNGFYYQSKPLDAYVTGMREKEGVIFTAKNADIHLLDILRDPYGPTSYSYYGKGKQYEYKKTFNISAEVNLNLDITNGGGFNQIVGTETGGVIVATSTDVTSGWSTSIKIPGVNIGGSRFATYNFTCNDVIKTSDDPEDVGAMADVYIGTTHDVICKTNQVITVIDEKTFDAKKASIEAGLIKVIQEGVDVNGGKRYLVTAEEMQPGVSYPSTFVYSQKHIITKVIPQLLSERNSLLIGGEGVTKEDVENLAKVQNKILYFYKGKDSSEAAVGQYGVDYDICFPNEESKTVYTDEIAAYNDQIKKWVNIIGLNEALKFKAINATNAEVKNYSISAGQNISYSENISYFDSGLGFDFNLLGFNIMGMSGSQAGSNAADLFSRALNANIQKGEGFKPFGSHDNTEKTQDLVNKFTQDIKNIFKQDAANQGKRDNAETLVTSLQTPTAKFEIKMKPDINIDFTNKTDDSKLDTFESGYEMKLSDDSYMNVSVYKTPADSIPDFGMLKGTLSWITDERNTDYLHQYVFVVNGGATRNPWCDADSTIFYGPGSPLGVRTQKIDNPVMTLSTTEINNVPDDEKATFMVNLINDSELTGNQKTNHASDFILSLVDESNENGVKISIDGMPLTDGRTFTIAPGESINKTIEVLRGDGYDFNNLQLQLACKDDPKNASLATFSIHYLPSSSPVKISAPTDKWVMNTFSPKDTIGYYVPIIVEGYNVGYKNFDHIEIQYKKSTEGDANWVNLCSYYADDALYEAASGTKSKEQIGTGKITHAFYGEKDPIEMKYDIRAVTFCRLGTGFVTKSSNVISGIKDTRRPSVFGKSQPHNGILTSENSIMLPFSEPIAYNYLDETSNFDIRGYVNSSDMDTNVGLLFSGDKDQDASTTVSRNLTGRDFTIDMLVQPEEDNTEMAFFNHGDEDDTFTFGINANRQLFVNCNGVVIKSVPLLEPINQSVTHVGVEYSLPDSESYFGDGKIRFFVGNSFIDNEYGDFVHCPPYEANSPIHLGVCKDARIGTAPFKGRMLEVRLWNQAVDEEIISAYDKKMLDGYQSRIIAYWPMRQSSGNAIDAFNGADLVLKKVNWYTESGYSLALNKSFELDGTSFQRSANFDYTLAFWMNIQEAEKNAQIFSAGGDALSEKGMGKLRIGFNKEGDFVVRSNGNEIDVYENDEEDSIVDGKWHRFALSVSHSSNIANIYIDGELFNQVQGDKLDGISMEDVRIGSEGLKGYIDHISFWHQALPQNYLEKVLGNRLAGNEMGLYVYLPFEASKRSAQGTPSDRFTVENQASDNMDIYKKPMIMGVDEKTDVSNSQNAPLLESLPLSNLKYSWTSDGTNLLINLDMKDSEINHRNIFLTVRDVEDLNGNTMANPYTWVIYTDRNILRWDSDTKNIKVNQNVPYEYEMSWKNITSMNTNYSIITSSPYISLSDEQGMAAPDQTNYLTFTIEKGMTPGDYVEYIWLMDKDNDMFSTLTLNITVEADAPEWIVDRSKFDNTMSIVASVQKQIGGHTVVDTDKRDVVGVFVNSECVGVGNIGDESGLAQLFLNVYGNLDTAGESLTFYLWDYSEGVITQLKPQTDVKFRADARIGMPPSSPLVLLSSETEMQNIVLEKGWNWVALNVNPNNPTSANTLFLDNRSFSDGDIIKDNNRHTEFSLEKNKWLLDKISFSFKKVYHIKVTNPTRISIVGTELIDDDLTFAIKQGWNEFPYLCKFNQPVNRAMADFTIDEKAKVGDIIKGINSFAVLSEDGWIGSLKSLEPGCGYYLYHTGAECSVTLNNIQSTRSADSNVSAPAKASRVESSDNNMIVIAALAQDENLPDDAVVEAYSGDDYIGEAAPITLPDGTKRYFITVPETGRAVQFVITDEENAQLRVGAMQFDATTCIGSLESPYILSTKSSAISDSDALYDLSGRKVNNKQATNGIYVKKGAKVVVK